ncbi:MAG: Undecaprenyl-phosphate 4-deoxy-4-formamido-L-arabinose transferase [Candidatus Heimdallarchaeota archaeon LC_3]|nr:MAG: Undecaprenyl-phosphate 4-deoxy-4-formamido-L-arabinose transferase [Candidatus Heimdallarchaeota archaeon LC_3]
MDKQLKDTTILIPTLNEYNNLRILLKQFLLLSKEIKILLVDDSSEKEYNKLFKLKEDYPRLEIIIIRGKKRGVGTAVRMGIKNIKTKYFIIMMGDLSDDPKDVPKLISKLRDGYQIVFGSRFIKGSYILDYPVIKFISNRLTNILVALIFMIKSHDITGAFAGYLTYPLINEKFISQRFSIFIEIPIIGKLKGMSYCEVPVTWRNRIEGQSNMKLIKAGNDYWLTILRLFFKRLRKH